MEILHDTIVFVLNWIAVQIERREKQRKVDDLRRSIREWEEALQYARRTGHSPYAAEAKEQYERLWKQYEEAVKEAV